MSGPGSCVSIRRRYRDLPTRPAASGSRVGIERAERACRPDRAKPMTRTWRCDHEGASAEMETVWPEVEVRELRRPVRGASLGRSQSPHSSDEARCRVERREGREVETWRRDEWKNDLSQCQQRLHAQETPWAAGPGWNRPSGRHGCSEPWQQGSKEDDGMDSDGWHPARNGHQPSPGECLPRPPRPPHRAAVRDGALRRYAICQGPGHAVWGGVSVGRRISVRRGSSSCDC